MTLQYFTLWFVYLTHFTNYIKENVNNTNNLANYIMIISNHNLIKNTLRFNILKNSIGWLNFETDQLFEGNYSYR